MRVTVYFLVRLISLYGLSAAAIQDRPYSDVLELNRIYNHFNPQDLEAAYGITPIEHPLTEPSYVKHLPGFKVHETDRSQEAPGTVVSSDSKEKRTWSTSGEVNQVNRDVQNSQEKHSLGNKHVPEKTSNEELSLDTERNSNEDVSQSRKPRDNSRKDNTDSKIPNSSSEEQRQKSSEESNLSNSLNKEKNQRQLKQDENDGKNVNRLSENPKKQRNSFVDSQMQNNDNQREDRLQVQGINKSMQQKKGTYQNSGNSNEQKSNSREENLVSDNKNINSAESQENNNQNQAIRRQQLLYPASADRTSQETWEQGGRQEINKKTGQQKSYHGGQSSANSREQLNRTPNNSHEQENKSYENHRDLLNMNQENSKEYRVWPSSHHHEHHNKHREHRHSKRSQSLLNSQEQEERLPKIQVENREQSYNSFPSNSKEQKNQPTVSFLVGPHVSAQYYSNSGEMKKQDSNTNYRQSKQSSENIYDHNKEQSQENLANNRGKRMQAEFYSNEDKSQESGSSEEQRGQNSEYRRGPRYQLSRKVSRKQRQFLVNSEAEKSSQIKSNIDNKRNRTPKYVSAYAQETSRPAFRRTKNSDEYRRDNNDDISVESSEEMRNDNDNYYSQENVMVPFVYSMRSPVAMNIRKSFLMSKSYMKYPTIYQSASLDNIHGFQRAEDMVRFHETLENIIKKNKNTQKNSTELITANHYAVEQHNVTTEDGYILQMIRLPGLQDSQNNTKKPVVFLMHGILGSSDDWLLMGPKKSLAYLLTDAGYDVWLGNARGNKYSRKHTSKNPEQPEFWKFSNDEIALLDLPAMIDYALNTTQQKQIYYVGFSQGNAQFFALASSRPEYNAKIKTMYALSPMAFMKNSNSMLVKMFSPENPLADFIEHYLETYSKTGEFQVQDKFLTLAGKTKCMATIGCNVVCTNINFIMSGVNVQQLEPEMAAMILGHTPAGASIRQVIQLGQATEDFRMFDYGMKMNQKVYGTSEPPSYNVKLITAPVAMFSSKDDWLAATEDVEKLEAELPNVILNYKIKNNYFTNLDFVYGEMATEMYKNIIKSMGEVEKITK